MLLSCSEQADTELLIVEGKSAANALQRVRDRQNQAVLALQGKIPNAVKAKSEKKLLENIPICNLLSAIAVDWSGGFCIDRHRYDRLIILTDPDADGVHARALVILLFYLHLRDIIDRGCLYVVYAPLYSIESRLLERPAIAYTDSHYQKVQADLREKGIEDTVTTRYKGVAGMDQELLIRCCISGNSRAIKPVSTADCQKIEEVFGL